MKLYAPHYYKDFTCIADRCTHSCCIGWEIDIDEESAEKYAALTDGYGAVIQRSTAGYPPHFCLTEGERCPHLAESGLCNIITELGEGYLCGICREHPRFYNYANGRCEVGLGMACEEACRLILTCDGFGTEEIGERDDADFAPYPTLGAREKIFSILADMTLAYPEKLEKLYDFAGVSPDFLTDGEWQDIFASLEYLVPEHASLFTCYCHRSAPRKELEAPLSRALAYLIYRHATEAEDEEEFRTSLGFCFLLERLLASLVCEKNAKTAEDMAEYARILSEEIEYSEDNTAALKFEISTAI